jgi:ABC-2 type transport system permease protein
MQVYKAYFKVIKKNLVSLLVYLGLFLIIAGIIGSMLIGQTSAQFSETKSRIAVINNDGNTPFSDGLVKYLAANANIINIKDNREGIQDALFYGDVSYVLKIPKGFSQSFLSDRDVHLEKSVSAYSSETANVDLMVNRYLNLSQLYVQGTPGIDKSELVKNVLSDLKVKSKVDYDADIKQKNTANLANYFRIIAFSILGILISGITAVMMSFNEENFSKRNRCSPVSPVTMNLQMVLANATFALVVWAVLCVFIFIMYGHFTFSSGILLLCINALVFTIASLGIGFLAGKFIKNRTVESAVTNVITLGISFISGVFVSQELLGHTVLTMASFTPGYWYVKAVNDIGNISVFSGANLTPVFYSMLIQLGFAAAFIVIALMIAKQRARTAS